MFNDDNYIEVYLFENIIQLPLFEIQNACLIFVVDYLKYSKRFYLLLLLLYSDWNGCAFVAAFFALQMTFLIQVLRIIQLPEDGILRGLIDGV